MTYDHFLERVFNDLADSNDFKECMPLIIVEKCQDILRKDVSSGISWQDMSMQDGHRSLF